MITIGIVATLGQVDYFTTCLTAIYKSAFTARDQLKVILVDNNANGALTNRLHQFYQQYKNITTVITNRTNKGYAFACNQILQSTDTPYVAFVHDDVIVATNTFQVVIENLERQPNIAIAMPLTSYANESFVCVSYIRKAFEKIKPSNKIYISSKLLQTTLHQLYKGSLDEFACQILADNTKFPLEITEQISSFCLIGRTDSLRKVGKFNTEFTHRGNEDKEFGLRLRQKGYEIAVCRTAYVHHHGNLTTDGIGFHFRDVIQKHDAIWNRIQASNGISAPKIQQPTITAPTVASAPVVGKIDIIDTQVIATPKTLRQPTKTLHNNRIIHVANLSNFTNAPRLQKAQQLFLQSIYESKTKNVTLIAGVREQCEFEQFEIVQLQRDAITEFGETKNLVFLKDLLDLAASKAGENDWLFYCNSDCCLSPHLYQALSHYDRQPYLEYLRLDVQDEPDTLQQVYTYPNKLYDIGVDGIAIRKYFYLQTRDSIPDFILGQPSWDTYLSVFYRTLIPSSQNYTDLYHPRHPQAWDFNKLSVSGQHNLTLYNEQVVAQVIALDQHIQRIVTEPDTAIVVAWFGRNPTRTKATAEAFCNVHDFQTINAHFIFVELIADGGETNFPEFANRKHIDHIIIHGNDSNQGLFQKEALYNIGAKHGSNYDYLIFLDSDIYSVQANWLDEIRTLLLLDNNKIIQGFETCVDSVDSEYAFAAWSFAYKNHCQSELYHNPGLCWAMTRAKFYEIGGFNPYAIFGGGDGLFAAEVVGVETGKHFLYVFIYKQFRAITRKLNVVAKIDHTKHNLVHIHHGFLHDRRYDERHCTLMFFSKPILELVVLDRQNILAWRDPRCIERELLAHKLEIKSSLDCATIYERLLTDRVNTAVITCVYGDRHKLAKQSIEQWLQQNLRTQIIVVELLFNDEPSQLLSLTSPRVLHTIVRGDNSNKDLCQKEALYNIGSRLIGSNIKYLIFIDNDVFSLNKNWFTDIRQKLIDNSDHVVQGFESVIDTKDPQYQFLSLIAWRTKPDRLSHTNPGICWALTRDKFEQFGRFNPYFVEYSGDSGFCAEILNTQATAYENYIQTFPCFAELLRPTTTKGIPTYVEDELVHLHHGYFRDRSYNARKYIVHRWNRSIQAVVQLDDSGLIRWNDPTCIERLSLQNIPSYDDYEDVDAFYESHNYKCRENSIMKFAHDPISTAHNNIVLQTNNGILTLFASAGESTTDALCSWSKNVLTNNGLTRLSLSAMDLAQNIVAVEIAPQDRTLTCTGLFPIKRNWQGATLINANIRKLTFDIRTTGSSEYTLKMQFESWDENKIEVRSPEIPITSRDYQQWTSITLPLSTFINSDYKFDESRLLLFHFYAPFDTICYLKNVQIQPY